MPSWLAFDSRTRTFSGTPDNVDVGAFEIVLTVNDPFGLTATQAMQWQIVNRNDAPQLSRALPDQRAREDQIFAVQLPADSFVDIDAGDALTWSARLANGEALPAWLSFDGNTRSFHGQPGHGDVGNLALTVEAVDRAGASSSGRFALTVATVNHAPTVVFAISAPPALQDQAYTWTLPAGVFADVDVGDRLLIFADQADGTALPAWLSFDVASNFCRCSIASAIRPREIRL